jgi:hypothetical protein
MSRQLLLAEASILIVAGIVVWFLVASPFDSGGSDPDPIVGNSSETPVPTGAATNDPTPVSTEDGTRPSPGDRCAPAVSSDFMRGNQILTYYGNPDAETLGILGQHPPEELFELLQDQARTYDDVNGFRGVQTGLHFIYSTAQFAPGEDGLYRRRTDSETVDEYVQFACEHGMFIFLDLQIGQADLETEIRNVLPWLERSHVHLALDPEFAMDEGEVPGEVIGELRAEEINLAQQILDDLIEEKNLPDKILIVHQFQESMIPDPQNIEDFPRIRLVIDMDGFGPDATKLRKYQQFSAVAEYGGIKLFFQQDDPLLTPEEVVRLHPDLVIYQ